MNQALEIVKGIGPETFRRFNAEQMAGLVLRLLQLYDAEPAGFRNRLDSVSTVARYWLAPLWRGIRLFAD